LATTLKYQHTSSIANTLNSFVVGKLFEKQEMLITKPKRPNHLPGFRQQPLYRCQIKTAPSRGK